MGFIQSLLINLGFAYFRSSEIKKAIESYNRLLTLLREVNDKSSKATLLQNFRLLFDYSKSVSKTTSLNSCPRAMAKFSPLGDHAKLNML